MDIKIVDAILVGTKEKINNGDTVLLDVPFEKRRFATGSVMRWGEVHSQALFRIGKVIATYAWINNVGEKITEYRVQFDNGSRVWFEDGHLTKR